MRVYSTVEVLKLLPEGICYVESIGLEARIVNIVLTFILTILTFLPIVLQKISTGVRKM